MQAFESYRRVARLLERERQRTTVRPPADDRAVRAELAAEEIWASTALAGSSLSRFEADALIGRGIAMGDHGLEAYVLVADYANAARTVRNAGPAGRRRPYLRAEEIGRLHALTTARAGDDRPGAWRSTTLAPFPGGMVAPPAWLVPREMDAFIERSIGGPPEGIDTALWVAAAHARFERIHPFATANGRVGRLVANLLLRRLGLPTFVVRPRDAAAYVAALRRADAGDPWPLGTLFARSLLRGMLRLAVAGRSSGDLVPLAALAPAAARAALYKAAQRGSLPAIRRGGTLFSTQVWVDEYRNR